MSKRNKIIYWVTTLWMSLGMVSSGVVQLIRMEDELERTVNHLGYPIYFITILAIWKLLGVIVALAPRLPLIKEWAYAGFFFAMSGALISHLAMNDPLSEIFPSVMLLILTIISWYSRPESRKLQIAK